MSLVQPGQVFLTALTSDPRAHRYQHTVQVCALQEDLSSLPYGDLTEVRGAGSAPRRHRAARLPRAKGQPSSVHTRCPAARMVPGHAGKSGPRLGLSPGPVLEGCHSGGGTNPTCVGSSVAAPGTASHLPLERQPRVLLLAAEHVHLTLPASPRWPHPLRTGARCWSVAGLEGPFLPHCLCGPRRTRSPPDTARMLVPLLPATPPSGEPVPLPKLPALHSLGASDPDTAPPDGPAPGTVSQAPLTRCWEGQDPSHLCPQAPSTPGAWALSGSLKGRGELGCGDE